MHTDLQRVALVGLGNHGRTIQEAVAEAGNLRVTTVYDTDAAETARSAERFGCDAAPSYDHILERDDVDAVVLVTPNHLHRPQAEAAFRAGKDVFIEKPIANTVADGNAMIEAADRSDRVLMVGHNMRFGSAARLANELIRGGRLGKIVSAEIHFSADNVKRLPADAWRLRPDQCPLLPVMQLGIHAVDLMHYLVGAIEEIGGYGRSVLARPGVTDSVAAVFRFEGGPAGTMVSHYCTPVLFEYRIAGTEGVLRATPHRVWFRPASGQETDDDFSADDRESYRKQMEHFGQVLSDRTAPETDGRVGLHALAVVEALARAIEAQVFTRVAAFLPPGLTDRSRS